MSKIFLKKMMKSKSMLCCNIVNIFFFLIYFSWRNRNDFFLFVSSPSNIKDKEISLCSREFLLVERPWPLNKYFMTRLYKLYFCHRGEINLNLTILNVICGKISHFNFLYVNIHQTSTDKMKSKVSFFSISHHGLK